MGVPKLAIVVPTRNSSLLLPRLVESLLNQSFLNFRVIFIDASTSSDEIHFLEQISLSDHRFSWVRQGSMDIGIYGAMNIGFRLAHPDEWLLFWGSDDWAFSRNSLYEAMTDISLENSDLIVCRGDYVKVSSQASDREVRSTSFSCFLNYRTSLFLGSTPPHQCTLIGPSARLIRDQYDDSYRIAGDLDYFLSLSCVKDLSVRSIPVAFVKIAVGGVSGTQHSRRLREVLRAYLNFFGILGFLPFILRYIQRILVLLVKKRMFLLCLVISCFCFFLLAWFS